MGGVNHNTVEIADINIDVITELFIHSNSQNLGQHNCGIIPYKQYIIKCLNCDDNASKNTDVTTISHFNELNRDLNEIFPKYYLWTDGSPYLFIKKEQTSEKYCKLMIMERLDGDLTKYIIESSYKNVYNTLDKNYLFYYEYLPKTTTQPVVPTEFLNDNALKNLNDLKKNVKNEIIKLVNELQPEITRLHHTLIKRGYDYNDLKFDNIGYKNNDKIKFYFIDEESGLKKIQNSDWKFYVDIWGLVRSLSTYSIFGQYTLRSIFDIPNPTNEFNFIDLKAKLVALKFICLSEDIRFKYIRFRHSSHNDSCVIQFCNGLFRLVRFDDYKRHQSDSQYNIGFEPVDELFENVTDLLKKLTTMYI